MAAARSKDLFEDTTMTFGQHLEELRVHLFKAVMGLAIGIIIGFLLGDRVVGFIQKPLSDALSTYYQRQAIERTRVKIEEMRQQGLPLPENEDELDRLVHGDQMLPDEFFVNPAEVIDELKRLYPNDFKEFRVPAEVERGAVRKDKMIRMFLWHPLKDDVRIRIKTLSAQEAFTIYLKASMMVGVIVASPWIFYQLWLFVAAGLYVHERRYIHIFLPMSLLLFFAGAALAFFFVFKPVLKFLFYFNSAMGIEPDPRISEWLGFVLTLPLGFGAAFQLPLVMLFLERIGVLSVATYMAHWRVSVLVIAVVAMLLTPDPYSMMMMVVPLTFLYFGGIALCRFMPRIRRPEFEEEEP